MALKPVNKYYENRLVCNFCGHVQASVGAPTEHEGEEIVCSCPFCNIGEMRYKPVEVTEYVDEEDN